MLQTLDQASETSAIELRLRPTALFATSIVLAFLAVLAVPWVDVRATLWFRSESIPGDLRTLLSLAEVFAHSYGVILILLTAFVLDRGNRRQVIGVAAFAFSSGIACLLVKVSVGRVRPNQLDLETLALPGGSLDTFVGLLPAYARFSAISEYAIQSFPSAHTATAVGLALGLSRLYPAGRWLFSGFAILAAMQRLSVGAHFVSDTLVGAAVAFGVCGLLLQAEKAYPRLRWRQTAPTA